MIRIRRRPLKKLAKEQKSPPKTISQEIPLSKKLEDNLVFFSSLFQESSDVIFRSIAVGNIDAAIIYIEGLSDTQKLNEQVLKTLLDKNEFDNTNFLLAIENRLPIC
ncbi:spore germination protein [Neobacillus sp. DY30]|uniref:spore germination protein n=1 Tax=Neobacillus sp. DY30 TaxID=3047871 RepID=UPI0024BFFDDB|nr:spore germination protein [Neobacillus sp. DY30]WHX98555.1 spore germination protein [Neobacillus sp. DY30]